MKATIHYQGAYEDEFVITADDFETLKSKALAETKRRGWKEDDCWSEVSE